MKTFTYTITINKPVEVVFKTVTDTSVFPMWAKAWGEGMQCTGEYTEGSNVLFTDTSGSGTKVVVEEIVPNVSIKMKHVAMVENGDQVVAEMDDMMKKWIGSREDYFFKFEGKNLSTFEIVGVVDEAFEEMMGAWPQALEYLKEVCEAE